MFWHMGLLIEKKKNLDFTFRNVPVRPSRMRLEVPVNTFLEDLS